MSHVHVIRTTRPEQAEFLPYYGTYISLVSAGDVVETLSSQQDVTLGMLRDLPEDQGGIRYASGKWSLREVVGHLCDVERVFCYRALRFARGDETPLAGFDENSYVARSHLDARSLRSLCDEYEAVRRASVLLFASFDADEWMRTGTANSSKMSVRAAAWICAGHELHHREILRTRYLPHVA
ncbi:MAG: DinB family protein [Gemmatimonadaceae bacterium]